MRRNSRPSNTSDLSWFSMYGLGVKLGISQRDVKQIAISSTGRYELVSDVVTGKKFIGPLQPISASIEVVIFPGMRSLVSHMIFNRVNVLKFNQLQ